jgi:hypothetical protein
VATTEEVEEALLELLGRLDGVDDSSLALMPSHRLIEARCPDLDLVRYAEWQRGRLEVLEERPDRRPDIRVSVRSDDLLAMTNGDLPFSRAFASNRIRLDASMTDLLRLRAVL